MIDLSHTEEIYSISRLNREVKHLLEGNFPLIWVEGEISGFKAHTSGHWYFNLKDANSQVRSAMFRGQNSRLNFLPQDGMQVLARVRVSLYENRGDYQLYVEHLEETGEGKLRQAFEALKKRLQAAGLFDAAHKKILPTFPKKIGVITSPTGAAIRDILSVLKRRFSVVPVIIYPALVQGDSAAKTLVDAIMTANRRQECDVLILARGGGSLEDLWAFNEEIVAQAIYQSDIPIISGVGHEIDFTIADFVADQRAPTPSAAAELVTPDISEILQSLAKNNRALTHPLQQKLLHLKQNLQWLEKNLQQKHPKYQLQMQQQRLDECEINLLRFQKQYLKLREQTLGTLAARLDILSPLATLNRGYAIAIKNNSVLRSVNQAQAGDKIHLRVVDGVVRCTVDNAK